MGATSQENDVSTKLDFLQLYTKRHVGNQEEAFYKKTPPDFLLLRSVRWTKNNMHDLVNFISLPEALPDPYLNSSPENVDEPDPYLNSSPENVDEPDPFPDVLSDHDETRDKFNSSVLTPVVFALSFITFIVGFGTFGFAVDAYTHSALQGRYCKSYLEVFKNPDMFMIYAGMGSIAMAIYLVGWLLAQPATVKKWLGENMVDLSFLSSLPLIIVAILAFTTRSGYPQYDNSKHIAGVLITIGVLHPTISLFYFGIDLKLSSLGRMKLMGYVCAACLGCISICVGFLLPAICMLKMSEGIMRHLTSTNMSFIGRHLTSTNMSFIGLSLIYFGIALFYGAYFLFHFSELKSKKVEKNDERTSTTTGLREGGRNPLGCLFSNGRVYYIPPILNIVFNILFSIFTFVVVFKITLQKHGFVTTGSYFLSQDSTKVCLSFQLISITFILFTHILLIVKKYILN